MNYVKTALKMLMSLMGTFQFNINIKFEINCTNMNIWQHVTTCDTLERSTAFDFLNSKNTIIFEM